MAFKIEHKYFRHSFFVTNIDKDSVFQGILGFDFMLMHNVQLSPVNKSFTIQDCEFSLIKNLNVEENSSFYVNELNNQNQDINSVRNGTERVNFITPTAEVINQRKNELLPSDFELSHLNVDQKNNMLNMLMGYSQIFSKNLKTLGHTNKIIPKISLIHNYPIKTLPLPVPQALEAEALNQLAEMQEAGIISRSATDWACPMLLVKKKGTENKKKPSFRLALDLRLLNRIIKDSAYPLPKISTIISQLSKYKFFSVLDLPSAYWQIDLPKDLQEIIAFTTPWGCFSCKRLPFGLKSASSNFQAMIDSVLDETNIDGYYAYQDDIVVGAQSFDEMLRKLKILFEILKKYNITLSPNKCKFFLEEINYLGFKICEHKIQPVESNIIKITSFPTPKTKRQLKRFIGVCNYYRSLIPSYASKIQPLIDLTSSKVKFKWEEKHQKMFDQLQKTFFEHPFVRLPQWDKEFLLNTDGSQYAISGVLLQEFEGKLCPVSYFSKSLNQAEKRYPAIKIELMALVKSILAFKHYLYGRHFTVLSDSKPLNKYKKSTSPMDITTKWLCEISEYTFTFKHIPGKSNVLADYFSRLEEDPPQQNLTTNPELINNDKEILPIVENTDNTKEIFLNNIQNKNNNVYNNTSDSNSDTFLEISQQTWLDEQKKDKNIRKIFTKIKNKQFNWSNKNYFIDSKSKLLMYVYHDSGENIPVIVVPNSLKAKVISIAHFSHFGIRKTYQFLRRRYFWYGMYSDTENFIKSCEKCITIKSHVIPHAPLQNSEIPKRPSEIISLDIVGPFSNQQYILTITDHFSRHMELYPLSVISSNNVTDCLFSYIASYGRPATVLSDQGKQFCSEVFEKLVKSLGIRIKRSSCSHPESNSVSERINAGIKNTVKILMQEGQSFKNAIRIHKNLYNGSIHTSTGFPPNVLHFGRPLSLIFDTFNPSMQVEQLDKGQYIQSLLSDLNKNYAKCYANLIEAQQKQNSMKNKNSKLREFKPDDIVYIKSRDKFNHNYLGPYKIIKRNTKVNYKIQHLHNPNGRIFTIHVDRLLLAPPRKQYLIFENSNLSSQSHNIPRYNLRYRNIY